MSEIAKREVGGVEEGVDGGSSSTHTYTHTHRAHVHLLAAVNQPLLHGRDALLLLDLFLDLRDLWRFLPRGWRAFVSEYVSFARGFLGLFVMSLAWQGRNIEKSLVRFGKYDGGKERRVRTL